MLDCRPGSATGSWRARHWWWTRPSVSHRRSIRPAFTPFSPAPITVRNELSGALIFHECHRPRHWLPEQIELVETIAAQVGIAIDNAQLYHETRRQLGELAILHSAAIATADSTTLDEALHKVAQAVYDALGDVSVAVMLLEPGTDDLNIRAGLGYAPGDLERIRVKVGQGVTGWVAQTGQPALLPDVTTDPRYFNFDPNVRSELCVPLRSGSRVVGVLNIESHQTRCFHRARSAAAHHAQPQPHHHY